MNHNLEIQKILLNVNSLTNLDDRINLLKQAINIADANNDLNWGYHLRRYLINTEQYTARSFERFAAFTWILNAYDTNPGYFSENDANNILCEYQWMAFDIYRNVDIPLMQIMAIFEDFKRRLEQHGFSQRAYHSIMVGWHLFIGEIENTRKHFELRDKFEKDGLYYESELSELVCIELVEKNFDKAIAMAHEQISFKTDGYISTIPMLCTLIYYLSKAGDKRADLYFSQIENEFSKIPYLYPYVLNTYALLMHHLAMNNPEKGWDYFEKVTEWEIGARDSLSFEVSLNLLPLLKQGGKRVLNLSSNLPYYRTDNTYNIEDLYDYYLEKATTLYKRFDERNKNGHFKEQFDEVFDTL